jgi:hypothetical protein
MQRSRRFGTPAAAEPMPDHQDIGTLYVLSNRDQSLAKIGLTRDSTPDARATAYERAHGIRWHVYWSAVTCHVAEAEAAVHRELDICRFALVPGAREVFHLTPEKARRVCKRYVCSPDSDAPPELRIGRPAWRSLLERITATVLLIAICWASLRRLHRTLRRLRAALH